MPWTCGVVLIGVGNDLPTTADGPFASNVGNASAGHNSDNGMIDNTPVLTNFNDTELTEAPKDVSLIVTHGVCVGSGATTTIIKWGKEGKLKAIHLGLVIA